MMIGRMTTTGMITTGMTITGMIIGDGIIKMTDGATIRVVSEYKICFLILSLR